MLSREAASLTISEYLPSHEAILLTVPKYLLSREALSLTVSEYLPSREPVPLTIPEYLLSQPVQSSLVQLLCHI